MLTRFKALFLGLSAIAGLGGLATAQNAPTGYNSVTNLNVYPGLDVSTGTVPVMTGCNTSAPSYAGGATAGKITTVGTTTCAPVLTWTLPKLGAGGVNGNGGYSQSAFAPTLTGVQCWLIDLTTVTDVFTQSAMSYTAPTATTAGSLTCSFTSRTIASGDVLLYTAVAF